MADKIAALQSLVKQIEGTMDAAGLALDKDGIASDETRDVIRYAGEAGDVRIEYTDNMLEVLATNEEGGKFKTIGTLLFEAESDNWGAKDIRSAANEVSETVSDFFGTTFVSAGATEKSQQSKGQKQQQKANTEAQAPVPKKKKKTKKNDSYYPIDLIYRLEAIFPDYAGKADENEEKYGTFLPEEYLQENHGIVEDILLNIRIEDRANCKKLFKCFNLYYDDGVKDTQSLIAVSILGIGAAKEEGLLQVMANYASEELLTTVTGVANYLNTSGGKRALKKYDDPKPYKESLKERWGRQGLEQAQQGEMLDSRIITGDK